MRGLKLFAVVVAVLVVGASAPAQTASDDSVRFPAGETSVEIPFELLANVPYIQIKVNGRGPFLFGVDTGASSVVLTAELQDAFGITLSGTGQGGGAGSGGYTTGIVAGDVEFTFADGLSVSSKLARAISMSSSWPLLGRKVYGYIGYDILRHFAVTFDYTRHRLVLSAASARPATEGLPFRQVDNNRSPQVDGQVLISGRPPIDAPLNIDTGAGGLIISRPIVDANHLVEAFTTRLPSYSTGAGGGVSQDPVVRIDGIRLGSYAVRRPIVALSQDKQGALTRSPFVNLGGNLLRRFKLTVDYPRSLLFVEPNENLNDPFLSDASGMLLKAEGEHFNKFSVRAVVPDSPAAKAGIAPGDIITRLDGRPVDRFSQWELMEIFKRDGKRHQISFVRGERESKAELKLRSLL